MMKFKIQCDQCGWIAESWLPPRRCEGCAVFLDRPDWGFRLLILTCMPVVGVLNKLAYARAWILGKESPKQARVEFSKEGVGRCIDCGADWATGHSCSRRNGSNDNV